MSLWFLVTLKEKKFFRSSAHIAVLLILVVNVGMTSNQGARDDMA